jgi:hypothetical protein
MAKRGRPPKKKKAEEIIDETTENVAKEKEVQDFVSDGIEKSDEIDISDVDYTTEEPDIYDLNTPKTINGPAYNPFSENVIEKEYRTPQVATAQSIPDIVEPSFQKPTYDDLIASNEENAPDDSQPKEGVDAFAQNEEGTRTKAEDESNADGLADVCLLAYGVLNRLGGKMARISDSKLAKYESEGILDRKMEIPVDAHTTATVEEVVDSINTQVDDIFVVTEEFEERTRPLMKKIFLKRGWGVSEEQQLLLYVATDVQEKIMAAVQIRKSATYQLDSFAQMYEKKLQMDKRYAETEYVAAGVEEKVKEQQDAPQNNAEVFSVETPIEEVEKSMVETQNPDIKVKKSDLDQIDVDNV